MHNYSLVLISTFLMAPASSYNFCTHIVTIFLYFVDNWNVSNFTFIPFPVIYVVGYIKYQCTSQSYGVGHISMFLCFLVNWSISHCMQPDHPQSEFQLS